ncbi:MAG: SDR family NAD(P)-dependent oxidoreductase [Gemmatimonadota bacterium]
MESLKDRIAIVTGANRGIGKAVAARFAREGAEVVMAVRDVTAGEQARSEIVSGDGAGLKLVVKRCDVADGGSVAELARQLDGDHPGGVHVLVNNAGILDDRDESSLEIEIENFARHLEVNVTGQLRMCQAIVPMIQRAGGGCVVNLSSTMGQFEGGLDGGSTGYRVSKAALNALTKTMAFDLKDMSVRVNSMHPGWVRTRMGGEGALEKPERAAETVLFLATLPPDGPTGKFWRGKREIPW